MPTGRNYNWVWFFVVIVLLGGIMAGSNLLYNLRQQFKPEDLVAAQKKWEQHGPADYDLVIRKEVNNSGSVFRDEIKVTVRGGRTTGATINGRELEKRLWPDYEMPGIFDWIERFTEIDTKPGANKVFCVARFDPVDGHLRGYVRSVRATQERQDLTIDFRKVTGDPKKAGP
jgi:hypothetical protein